MVVTTRPATARASLAGTRRRAVIAAAAALASIALLSAPASAKRAGPGSETAGELYSIEKRDVMGSHEISFMIGTLPKNAFETGLTLMGSYTYHFNHLFAWEIAGGTYSINLGTGLKPELRERFDVQPERPGILQAMVHSNFVFKPLYGKLALLNDKLQAAEMFFVIGPALAFYDDLSKPFGFDAGIALRLFLGRYFSLRFDIRDYLFLPGWKDVENHYYVSLGLSLTFGFGDDEEEED